MGASSVTGVSGPGDALNKGPGNGRVQVTNTTPQILLCGSVITDGGGSAEIDVSIPGSSSDLNTMACVFAQCVEGSVDIGRNYAGTGDDEKLIRISFTAAANRLVHYMVVSPAPYRGNQGL